MPKEKKEKPKIKYSAGSTGYGGQAYEQVANNKFAFYTPHLKAFTIQEESQDGEYMIFPMLRPPWKLATQPIEHTNPNQLYDDIRTFIVEHLFLPTEELYDVLTAWVLASWIPEAWTVVPYLFFFGALSTGKTRGLEVLERLSYRGILSANFSTAALFRASEIHHPTVFLDETEVYNQETRIEIIALLNCGYRRGQFVHRLRRTEHGHELESFDVFGFKALAGTEGMRKTLESRSIMIRMIKALTPVRKKIDEQGALGLRNRLLGFRLQTLARDVRDVGDVFPEVLPLDFGDGRLEELFDCLLRVAPKGSENIRKHAKEICEIRSLEEKASEEAEIVRLLIEHEADIEEGVILNSVLKTAFNEGRSEKEKWKTKSIGRILRKLGFVSKRVHSGRGFRIDSNRLEYLAKIYGVDIVSGRTSRTSPSSHPQKSMDEMFYPTCILCNKPIHEEPKYLNGQPCHSKCEQKFMKNRHPKGYERTKLK